MVSDEGVFDLSELGEGEDKRKFTEYEAIFRSVVESSKAKDYNSELITEHYKLLESFLTKYKADKRVVKGCRRLIDLLGIEALILRLYLKKDLQNKEKKSAISTRVKSRLSYLEKKIKEIAEGEYDEAHKQSAGDLKSAYASLKERLEKAGKPYLEEESVLELKEFVLESDEDSKSDKTRERRRN